MVVVVMFESGVLENGRVAMMKVEDDDDGAASEPKIAERCWRCCFSKIANVSLAA